MGKFEEIWKEIPPKSMVVVKNGAISMEEFKPRKSIGSY
jgi:hypothetical protein